MESVKFTVTSVEIPLIVLRNHFNFIHLMERGGEKEERRRRRRRGRKKGRRVKGEGMIMLALAWTVRGYPTRLACTLYMLTWHDGVVFVYHYMYPCSLQ